MSINDVVAERLGGEPPRERTPPHDLLSEQSTLGGMLLSKDAVADVVETLRGSDFYVPKHEVIFEAILSLYSHGEPTDVITVTDELMKTGDLQRAGGVDYLHTLTSIVPTAANAGYYASIVQERALLRRLVDAGTRIVQMGYDGEGEAVELVNQAQAEVYSVTGQEQSEDYVPLEVAVSAAVEEIETAKGRDGEMTGVPTGFGELDELTNGLHAGQMVVVAARPAMGKALALDTPLPTPAGWTTMGEVRVGDALLDAEGRPTRVVAATEVMNDHEVYEVEFSDGSVIVADAQHQWLTETRAARKSRWAAINRYNRARNQRIFPSVVTTEEIARTLTLGAEGRANHAVLNAAPLELPSRRLPIAPYLLGAWLGDGHAAGTRITSETPEIPAFIEHEGYAVAPRGNMLYSVGLAEPGRLTDGCCLTRSQPATAHRPYCRDCYGDHGTLTAQLRTLGVLGDKHIPAVYLRASQRQRRALLAGLMDTDGTVVKGVGSCQFAVTNKRLADDVFELVVSLGYECGRTSKRVRGRNEQSSTCYILNFSTTDDVFWLGRKNDLHRAERPASTQRIGRRYIKHVRRVESVPVRCVQVDNDEHMYLAGEAMIPTHNSTLALDFARASAIKHNQPAIFFSLEMGKTEIAMRLLSAEGQIPLQKLRKGDLDSRDWTTLASTRGRINDAPLYVDDSPNMTLVEIRAKCRRLKQRVGLKMIIIDYLQLMTSGKKVESRQQEVSEFSRALKLMAKELQVPVIALSQLNRGSEQRQDKRPMVSDLRESGCLTADTRVLRADTGAETTMGEMYALGFTDVPVWALDDSLRYVRRHLTHVFPTGVRQTFRLRLASGKEVEATANHPFLTYEGWTPLGELEVGARVGVPRHVPGPERHAEWDDRHVIMLAHLLGDGSFVARQPLRYASVDERNLAAVTDAAAAWGITPVRDEYAAARVTTLRLPAPFRLTHGRRNPIAEWLDDMALFGARSHEKFVPMQVFHLPKEQIALFLKHIWATDGSVTINKNGRSGRIYYASTSRRLVDDLARLLLRFGISARLRNTSAKGGYRQGYTLDVSGVDDQRRFLQEIGVHGDRGDIADSLLKILRDVRGNTNVDTIPKQVWEDVRDLLAEKAISHRTFQAALGSQYCGSAMYKSAPSRERLGRIATVLDSEELDLMAVNDLMWDEIVAIEPVGEKQVFDATVVGGHNFIANGIAVHNSIEQDADMVILLHRDEVYDKQSRPGEADLIVAKHRNGPTAEIAVAFQGHYSRFHDMVHMDAGFGEE